MKNDKESKWYVVKCKSLYFVFLSGMCEEQDKEK